MSASRLTRIDPSQFISVPWKNGGGTSTTIAQQHVNDAAARDWSSLVWQLGRTQIVTPAPFSDLSGFDRMQVLVGGSGLVLKTPGGEIDVRQPFQPVRFKGETSIVSRLENGPVEVINLMAARELASIDMVVLKPGTNRAFRDGLHVVYAPEDGVILILDGENVTLASNHAARVSGEMTMESLDGNVVVATVVMRS